MMDQRGASSRHLAATLAMVLATAQANVSMPMAAMGLQFGPLLAGRWWRADFAAATTTSSGAACRTPRRLSTKPSHHPVAETPKACSTINRSRCRGLQDRRRRPAADAGAVPHRGAGPAPARRPGTPPHPAALPALVAIGADPALLLPPHRFLAGGTAMMGSWTRCCAPERPPPPPSTAPAPACWCNPLDIPRRGGAAVGRAAGGGGGSAGRPGRAGRDRGAHGRPHAARPDGASHTCRKTLPQRSISLGEIREAALPFTDERLPGRKICPRQNPPRTPIQVIERMMTLLDVLAEHADPVPLLSSSRSRPGSTLHRPPHPRRHDHQRLRRTQRRRRCTGWASACSSWAAWSINRASVAGNRDAGKCSGSMPPRAKASTWGPCGRRRSSHVERTFQRPLGGARGAHVGARRRLHHRHRQAVPGRGRPPENQNTPGAPACQPPPPRSPRPGPGKELTKFAATASPTTWTKWRTARWHCSRHPRRQRRVGPACPHPPSERFNPDWHFDPPDRRRDLKGRLAIFRPPARRVNPGRN